MWIHVRRMVENQNRSQKSSGLLLGTHTQARILVIPFKVIIKESNDHKNARRA